MMRWCIAVLLLVACGCQEDAPAGQYGSSDAFPEFTLPLRLEWTTPPETRAGQPAAIALRIVPTRDAEEMALTARPLDGLALVDGDLTARAAPLEAREALDLDFRVSAADPGVHLVAVDLAFVTDGRQQAASVVVALEVHP